MRYRMRRREREPSQGPLSVFDPVWDILQPGGRSSAGSRPVPPPVIPAAPPADEPG